MNDLTICLLFTWSFIGLLFLHPITTALSEKSCRWIDGQLFLINKKQKCFIFFVSGPFCWITIGCYQVFKFLLNKLQ